MKKLNFSIIINASPEKVWDILWKDETYRKWTSAFAEGSHAVTDWKEGSKVLFLGPGGEGMVSRIAASTPHEFMSIEHLGEVTNGVEDTTSEKVKQWAGAHENYILKKTEKGTELQVEMDITDEFKEMFSKIWPVALDNIKQLSES